MTCYLLERLFLIQDSILIMCKVAISETRHPEQYPTSWHDWSLSHRLFSYIASIWCLQRTQLTDIDCMTISIVPIQIDSLQDLPAFQSTKSFSLPSRPPLIYIDNSRDMTLVSIQYLLDSKASPSAPCPPKTTENLSHRYRLYYQTKYGSLERISQREGRTDILTMTRALL